MLTIGEVAWVAVDSDDQVLISPEGKLIERHKDQLESELHEYGFEKDDYTIKQVKLVLVGD